jgi:hypothetical protein
MRGYAQSLTWMVGVMVFLASPAMAGAAETPTFTKDVAPILFESCVSCHRPGEVAPMSLLTYQSSRPWARSIKGKVVSREMPPWHADPKASLPFKNDRRLSQDQVDTIVAWVDGGAPQGDVADLPAAPTFDEGWGHPTGRDPDLIISLPVEYEIPADGIAPQVRFTAKLPFDEDVFAEATESRPGNRAVVHHFLTTPFEIGQFDEAPDPGPTVPTNRFVPTVASDLRPTSLTTQALGFLSFYTPGNGFEIYPTGYGKRITGGPKSYVTFSMHYQPTGKPETDRSSLGIWLAEQEAVEYEMIRDGIQSATILAEDAELLGPDYLAGGTHNLAPSIPAYASNYKMVAVEPFEEATTIYKFHPHAHLRGKDFTYTLVYPDGREQTILTVPLFDFNWQTNYELETPLRVPAGTKLVATGHFDNSTANRYNPAPDRDVIFDSGGQSWDEMFWPFTVYAEDVGTTSKTATQD